MNSNEETIPSYVLDWIYKKLNEFEKRLEKNDEILSSYMTPAISHHEQPSWSVATAVVQPRPPPDPPNGQPWNYVQPDPDQQVPTYGLVSAYAPEFNGHQCNPYPANPSEDRYWGFVYPPFNAQLLFTSKEVSAPQFQSTCHQPCYTADQPPCPTLSPLDQYGQPACHDAHQLNLSEWQQPSQTNNPHTPQPPYGQSAYQNVGYPTTPTNLPFDQPYTASMPLVPPRASFVNHQGIVTEYQKLCNGRPINQREEMTEMWDTIAGGDSEENRDGVRTTDNDTFNDNIDNTGIDPAHPYGSDREQSPRRAPEAEKGDGDAEINDRNVSVDDLAMVDYSAAALVDVSASLDHCTSELFAIVDVAAALSCEALRAEVPFNLMDPGDGFTAKDTVVVAADFKLFSNGSKLVNSGRKLSNESLAEIPSLHGEFSDVSGSLHSRARVQLNFEFGAGSVKVFFMALGNLASFPLYLEINSSRQTEIFGDRIQGDDGSFPSINLCAAVLKIIFDLPIDLDQFGRREQLKKNGLEKVIMFLMQYDEEAASNQKLAQELVRKWSRLICNKTHSLLIFYWNNAGRHSTIRCAFDPGGDMSLKRLFSTLVVVSWFPP